MIIVKMTPMAGNAGGPRVFNVKAVDHNLATGEVVLRCRDGEICLKPVGAWRLTFTEDFGKRQHSCDEAEAIHNETSLLRSH